MKIDRKQKPCSHADCRRNAHYSAGGRKGYCSTHYKRLLLNGSAEIVGRRSSPALDWLRQNASYKGDECLAFPFHVAKDGYGRAHDPDTGKVMTASRFMCILAHGTPEDESLQAAHSCGQGNKACTNPNHLYWTTHADNQADRVDHGTSNRGEQQWRSKLTKDDVRYIRSVRGAVPQGDLAQRFGVHQTTINNIYSGKNWGWLK